MVKQSKFRNMLRFLFQQQEKNIAARMTPSKARKAQKKCFEQEKAEIEVLPYMEISKQLYHQKSEIFRAAVFYLEQIALNGEANSKSILDILLHFQKENKRLKEDQEYLDAAIADIKDNCKL